MIDSPSRRMIAGALFLLIIGHAAAGAAAKTPAAKGKKTATKKSAARTEVLTHTIELPNPPKIIVNGTEAAFDVAPQKRNGVLFIAATSALADMLGADFGIDSRGGTFAVRFKTAESNVLLTEGKAEYLVNEMPREFPDAPYVSGGYLMVPARPFFEAFGFTVAKDAVADAIRADRSFVPGGLDLGIPADVILKKPEQTPVEVIEPQAATETIAVATETVETPPDGQPPAAPSRTIEFSYDNTMSFENIQISGDRSQSSLVPRTVAKNQFNLRLQGEPIKNIQFNSVIRTTETNDDTQKRGEVNKFAMNFQKGSGSLSLYDLFPKFSNFALKNYQLQGAMYDRPGKSFNMTALFGKTPKRLRDSEYVRYVRGFRVSKEMSYEKEIGVNYVRTKDTGGTQGSDRVENELLSINASAKLSPRLKITGEYGRSGSIYNDARRNSGKARSLQAQYRNPTTTISANYDQAGADFNSETAYITSGRRETSMLYNRKLNARSMFGGGYRNTVLGGEGTRAVPLLYSVNPLKARPNMKLTMQRNYEKTSSSSGPRLILRREYGYADRFGDSKFDVAVERRKQKDPGRAITFRTSQRYRIQTPIGGKTDAVIQYKIENRTGSTTPLTRYCQVKFSREIIAWTDMILGFERYYNGTASNRNNMILGLKQVNVEKDTELSLEYEFYNYRDHNDNAFRVNYSFYR